MHSWQSDDDVISLLSLSEALSSVLAVSGVLGGIIQLFHILLLPLEEKKGGSTYIVPRINYFSL